MPNFRIFSFRSAHPVPLFVPLAAVAVVCPGPCMCASHLSSDTLIFFPVSVKVPRVSVFSLPVSYRQSLSGNECCALSLIEYHQVLDRCLELETDVAQIPQLKRQVDRYRRSHTDMEVANREQVRALPSCFALSLSCFFFFLCFVWV